MSANRKGDRRERELVNELDALGFAVMRAPASGSATERELPDVLAGNAEEFYAIEAKSSAGDPIYLSGEEVESLVYFARNFGARPRVAARFDREDWYFFHPADLHQTDGGNYRVKAETALADGTDLHELAGVSAKVTLDEAASDGETGGEADDGAGGEADGEGTPDETNGDDGDGSDGGDGTAAGRAVADVLRALDRGALTVDEATAMLED